MGQYLFLAGLILLGCLGSCTRKSAFDQRLREGPVSMEELHANRGKPQSVEPTPNEQEMHNYPTESFQIAGKRVTHWYRQAKGPERSLQHWLELWREDVYHYRPLEENGRHSPRPSDLYQLRQQRKFYLRSHHQ